MSMIIQKTPRVHSHHLSPAISSQQLIQVPASYDSTPSPVKTSVVEPQFGAASRKLPGNLITIPLNIFSGHLNYFCHCTFLFHKSDLSLQCHFWFQKVVKPPYFPLTSEPEWTIVISKCLCFSHSSVTSLGLIQSVLLYFSDYLPSHHYNIYTVWWIMTQLSGPVLNSCMAGVVSSKVHSRAREK